MRNLKSTIDKIATLLVRAKPATVFLAIALPMGLIFVFLTAPFGVADEPNHFYKSYQVSQGVVYPVTFAAGQYGGNLPENFTSLINHFGGNYTHPIRQRITFGQLWAGKNLRLDTSKDSSVAFTNTAIYEPLNYLPQAVGVFFARLLPGRPDFLLAFYSARLLNMLVGVILIYFAIKKLPFAKWGVTALFLTPMALFQFASLSPDSLTFGVSALAIAYSLACLYPARVLTRKELIVLGGLTLAMALLRVPYAGIGVIPFGVLLCGLRSKLSVRKAVITAGGLALVSAFLLLYWQHHFSANVNVTIDPNVIPKQQLHTLWDVPWMAEIILRTQLSGFFNIVTNGVIGVLGWLDTPLPQWTITGYAFFLIASFFLATPGEKSLKNKRLRLAFLGLFLLLFFALDIIEYLYGSPVRSPEIQAIQGRYYISLLILVPITTHGLITLSRKDWVKFHLSRLGFIGLTQIVAIIIVLNHSWLWPYGT